MQRWMQLMCWWLALPAWCVAAERPNVVFVLCDDLGYGDVHCLAPATSRIPTPHADALAREGMVFTDAHSGSSVCSPTRYGLMTGRYSWRTRLQKGVVTGYAPSLIAKDRPTVASFLRSQGYHTAVIGKWHLDFLYLDPQTGEPYRAKGKQLPPVMHGFPTARAIVASTTFMDFIMRHMQAVIENDRVLEHDEEIHMLPRLTRKAVEYIDSRAGQQAPFFLYLPLGSPHTPILPTAEWQGRSKLGKYGDFVMQTDHALGEVMAALRRNGMDSNTLLILSSDNGCSKAAGIPELEKLGHRVSAHLRGSKADIWDGGHRVPFIVRWPGKVQPGTSCDQLICLVDVFATMADMLGETTPSGSCEDSVSFLASLSGGKIQSTRAGVVHHSSSGHFAYRTGDWKLVLARGSGGWTSPRENEVKAGAPPAQLYDLSSDPGERHNLYTDRPDVAERLLNQLKRDIRSGRSTDGPASSNDVDRIVLWKSGAE